MTSQREIYKIVFDYYYDTFIGTDDLSPVLFKKARRKANIEAVKFTVPLWRFQYSEDFNKPVTKDNIQHIAWIYFLNITDIVGRRHFRTIEDQKEFDRRRSIKQKEKK